MVVFVVGEAASGKSAHAESVAVALGQPRFYLATMNPYGEIGQARVARHRALRAGKGFTTIECNAGLDDAPAQIAPSEGAVVLLECLATLCANELFAEDGTQRDPQEAFDHIMEGIVALAQSCTHLVIVGDIVGRDTGDYGQGVIDYMRLLGRVDCACASISDTVIEVVAGIPHTIVGDVA